MMVEESFNMKKKALCEVPEEGGKAENDARRFVPLSLSLIHLIYMAATIQFNVLRHIRCRRSSPNSTTARDRIDISDLKGDKKFGINSFAVRLGKKRVSPWRGVFRSGRRSSIPAAAHQISGQIWGNKSYLVIEGIAGFYCLCKFWRSGLCSVGLDLPKESRSTRKRSLEVHCSLKSALPLLAEIAPSPLLLCRSAVVAAQICET
ncbi:hypothetical protein KSP39_PZI009273 [Platanthera zijinensis]|uniref:Uncharacterized protein n=1 Tax=Platanthera zijinensis TaxID=2320716 RepID=A0AAP0BKY8_9ASPA